MIKDSPVLQRLRLTTNQFEGTGTHVPTMEEWTFAKQKWQRTSNYVRGDPKHENAEILPGHKEKRYA